MNENYLKIFDDLIGNKIRDIVLYSYESEKHIHTYKPFYHDLSADTEIKLAQLMRQYIYFYAYSENEVIDSYNRGRLKDLEHASQHALRERLPNRTGDTNGLYSELLLDLLITLYVKNINKLATRAIYRQMTDNSEIKGYDGLHLIIDELKKYLWLGQAKMSKTINYCISGIKKDLYDKANMLYTSEQLYFIADKEKSASQQSIDFLNQINEISYNSEGLSSVQRGNNLETFFKENEVKIVFPCLLAYSSPEVYKDPLQIENTIKNELQQMITTFDIEFQSLLNIDYEVNIWFIPIRLLDDLRHNMVK